MALEKDPVAFLTWFPPALGYYLLTVLVLAIVGCLFGFVVCVIRHGPLEAPYVFFKTLFDGVVDLAQTSLRRTGALTLLAVKESIRRKVVVAFLLFAVVLLFGAWFLDVKSDSPAKVYMSVVLYATTYMTLALVLFLSAFSLPQEIKTKTSHTLMTKPVRMGEVVLGRIAGVTVIGTVLLAIMCAASYAFVVRGVEHGHHAEPYRNDGREVEAASLLRLDAIPQETDEADEIEKAPQLREAKYHQHRILRRANSKELFIDTAASHTHSLRRVEIHEGVAADDMLTIPPYTLMVIAEEQTRDDGQAVFTIHEYEIGSPVDMLQARVPIYGDLEFMDKASGRPIVPDNIGDEWQYRRHIEGGTAAAAVWSFDNVSEERFPDGIPAELTLDVFRTHKGNIEARVRGHWFLRNPETGAKSVPVLFTSEEFATKEIIIPRKVKLQKSDGTTPELDVFKTFVADGNTELWIQCADPGQYFGAAQSDCYLRSADGYFFVNFLKCYLTIWFLMVIVISFGVALSTFLNAPVAMLATFVGLAMGIFRPFITDLFDKIYNSDFGYAGPVESLFRVITNQPAGVELDAAKAGGFVKGADVWIMRVLTGMTGLFPDFGRFNSAEYLSEGFNISFEMLGMQAAITVGFLCALTVIGYFFLKTREIAA